MYPIRYRFHHCDYRRMLADGLYHCLCNCKECEECMKTFSQEKEGLPKMVVEILKDMNTRLRDG